MSAEEPIDPSTPRGVVARWVTEINLYEKDAGSWHEKGRKIVKRYKDERGGASENAVRYNILWSNIQTFLPACYGRNPKPEVERRFKDKDPVGRAAAEVLERSLEHCISTTDFKHVVRAALLDRLLPGRGLLWVRYVPHMRDMAVQGTPQTQDDGAQVTDDAEPAVPPQEVYFEEVKVDYVHWEDFGHSQGRTWEELPSVWRKTFLTRKQLINRFGKEIGSVVPLGYTPIGIAKDKVTDEIKKAIVYECWDKIAKRVTWICKEYAEQPLDELDDPLKLSGFWPCPRPMFSTLANDSMLPVPDYRQYQDQAAELDEITARIASITRSIKVAGVHDASAEGLQRLLSEGVDNQLIPVTNWAGFSEKGGLDGAVQFLPMKEIMETLLGLYEAREKVKQDLYEITGMPDIIRGSDEAEATATAQRIKGQFGSIRLRDMQDDVQRFVRDLLNIIGEVMAEHFGWQTLSQISGIRLMSGEEKVQAQMQAQQGIQMQPEMEKLLHEPAWEEVEALLRNNCARSFRIDIETDSTIGEDEELERTQRLEMVEKVGEFISKSVQAAESLPEAAPMLAEMVMYVVRSFKNARTLESSIDELMEKLVAMSKNPQPKPNPDVMKVQGQLQLEQAKQQGAQANDQRELDANIQLERFKAQGQKELEQFKAEKAAELAFAQQSAQQQQAVAENQIEAQRDQQKAAMDAQLAQFQAMLDAQNQRMDNQIQVLIAQMNNAAKVEVAEIAAETTLEAAQTAAANQASED